MNREKALKSIGLLLIPLVCGFGVLNARSVFADEALGKAGATIDGGPELHYFKYEEPDVMEEEGMMFGAFGRAALRIKENRPVQNLSDVLTGINTFMFEGRLSFGNVDYTSNGTGSVDDIFDFLAEIRGLAGFDLPAGDNHLLTPYAGLGYRYWFDELGGKVSTTGDAGYDRESNYLYLPIGIATKSRLSGGWNLGLNLEYDLFLDGQQKSHLEDVSPALSTLDNDQNDGYGIRGSVSLTKEMPGSRVSLLVEPFVRFWDIDDSSEATVTCGGTPCLVGYEPRNKTLEVGARVGARF